MSTEIQRASADAVAAAAQSDRYAEILAVVAAVQAVQAAPQHHGCSCATPARPRRSAGQVAAIAAGTCACGAVACAMFLAVALAAVGVAVSALVCLFIVREIRKGK
ncbi:MAG TPA: hypothetical protein VFY14_22220 [Streptomyces sp.]|nr:hypothetical protein [Streptomyces sp.]